MSKRSHFQRRRGEYQRTAPAPISVARTPLAERKRPVVYGKPFILLEDNQKNAFIFKAGQWVQFEKTIAECRLDCQVKELPQKINGRSRYQVSAPIVPNE